MADMRYTAEDVAEQIYQSDDLAHVTGWDAHGQAHASPVASWARAGEASLITLANGQSFRITVTDA